MSVRFSGSAAQALRRTADLLSSNAAYTWMAWLSPSSLASYMTIWNQCDGTFQHFEALELPNDSGGPLSATLLNNWNFARADSTTHPGTGTWYHVALVRESATALKLYVNGTLEATNTADVTGRAAPTQMEVGQALSNNPWNGRVAAMKAWSAVLTQPQVAAEMAYAFPVVSGSVYGWWPLQVHTDVADKSGNGRNWTVSGTLSTEADPPGVTSWSPAPGCVLGSTIVGSRLLRGLR